MKKPTQANFPEFEAEMLKAWNKEKTFERSLELRHGAKRYSFYDGPPFANGLPHFGHSLVTAIKDSIGRYRTMRGYYVERRNGWDCHGLPVEFAVEKEFGVSGKKQIEALGIDKFNAACRDSVFRYKGDWEEFFRRIGRWTDTEHAYATIDRDYTESVWWMLGQVHEKGFLYKGYKSMPYCPRCETPLSNFELNEGYRDDVDDPSVFVLFPLVDNPKTKLLAWTTTPWTLPANAALAVDDKADYVYVELKESGDNVILAKQRLSELDLRQTEYKVVKSVKGKELVGLKYQPLYDLVKPSDEEADKAWRVYHDDSVSLEDGTGILHVAPRYGETDLELGQREGLPLIESADRSGRMTEQMGEYAGMFFKEADPHIVADLTRQGRIFAAETFKHTYPFCYRCESPLLYFAINTWFVKVSAIRDRLLVTAEEIDWTPAHIKAGRFGKWLEGARDWAISRNRYWGAPLPIWVNEKDENDYIVVTSVEELVTLAGLKDVPDDLHRPGIDKVVINKDGQTYRRVPEVFDCWFESGSMPVAQQHYPFDNQEVFKESFPADYIGEGLDQTRLWFYVQHVLSTIAFDRPAYKHVLVNGMVMAADGQKLSKRLRNYPPVEEVFAQEGADTLRLYLLGNDQALGADYMRFSRDALRDINRNVLGTLWNTYSFLAMYAETQDWQPGKKLVRPASENLLDQWILSRLDQVISDATVRADNYELAQVIRLLRELVDDLSNWYLRRSRRRFKSDDQGDKASAFATLHYVLVRTSQLLAPWAPFASDKIYRELTADMDLPESVHLTDWPAVGKVDAELLSQMSLVREAIAEGLALRASAGIKVRQPLSKATMFTSEKIPSQLAALAADELNVKKAIFKVTKERKPSTLNTNITQELKAEGVARDVIRHVQDARKKVGTAVDDRINLSLYAPADSELASILETYRKLIATETLADEISLQPGQGSDVPVMAGGQELYIEVTKR